MILVTGATGMTGAHLVAYLLKKEENIRALYREKSNFSLIKSVLARNFENGEKAYSKIEWWKCDLLDSLEVKKAIKGCEKVYHTAAIVSFDPLSNSKVINNNVEVTRNIVDGCLLQPKIKLLHVSSIASLGRVGDGEEITENTFWREKKRSSAYSISKYRSEEIVWDGIKKGLIAVIVNPSIILGPGQWDKGSAELISTVWNGLKFYTLGVNGYVDVRDVSMAMIQLMESKISGERFILNSENISYKDLFFQIADSLSKPRPRYKVTPIIAAIAWRFESIKAVFTKKRPIITKDTARTSMRVYNYSSKKIEEAIGYKFIPIAKSVEDTCRLFLQSNK